jgi:hypothetical protein
VRNNDTIHPLVLIFPDGSSVKRDVIVLVSDDLISDHAAVKAFIQILAEHM